MTDRFDVLFGTTSLRPALACRIGRLKTWVICFRVAVVVLTLAAAYLTLFAKPALQF